MQPLSRRQFTAGALGVAAATGMSKRVRAATWPQRTVTVVVPYPAGGNTDTMSRIATNWLASRLGQGFIIDNRGGAGGAIGTAYVARAERDGYTLLFAASPQVSIVPLVQKVAYDPDRDLTPIAALGTTPHILAINSRVPANNLPEFIAYAKANPGKISYASIGFGTIGHLCAALFAARAGIDLVHVPYKGTVQANTDLLTGQVDMLFSNVDILQFIGRNELRMIGVSTAQRIPELPDVLTLNEVLPGGFDLISWNGLLAPKGTPQSIVELIAAEMEKATQDAAVVQRLRRIGITPGNVTLERFADLIHHERVLFKEAIVAAGLAPT